MENIAQGSEPSPPALATAAARPASLAPAIGAWTIGSSVPTSSVNRVRMSASFGRLVPIVGV